MLHHIILRKIQRRIWFLVLASLLVAGGIWVSRNAKVYENTASVFDTGEWRDDFETPLTSTPINEDISFDISFLNDDYIHSKVKLESFDLGWAKISGDFFVKGKVIKEKGSFSGFKGKLFSKNTELNKDPFMNINMSFEIAKDEVKIESLRLNKTYELRGKIGLKKPFETDLRFDIKRADIRDVAIMTKAKNPNIAIGIMSGFLNISGPFENLISSGILQSKYGKFGNMEYASASAKLEGFGPIISLVDTKLKYGNGTITVRGFIDLRNISKGAGALFNNLAITSDMKTVAWRDWDIHRHGSDELSMTKEINEKMTVGFKTVAREPSTTYRDKESPEEMTLNYKLGEESLSLKLKDNEEFFGIEHNVKF